MQRAALPCWRASNPIIGLSLLQRASAKQAPRARAQQPPHLHFAAVARHHAPQYACTPARRRSEVLDRTGIHGRRSVTRLERKPEHEARALRWQKLDYRAADGWRGVLARGACHRTAACKVQRGRDQHEWGGDLELLHDRMGMHTALPRKRS
jgi:hypothetical protein